MVPPSPNFDETTDDLPHQGRLGQTVCPDKPALACPGLPIYFPPIHFIPDVWPGKSGHLQTLADPQCQESDQAEEDDVSGQSQYERPHRHHSGRGRGGGENVE